MNDLAKAFDYNEANYIAMPGHCIPSYDGYRVAISKDPIKDSIFSKSSFVVKYYWEDIPINLIHFRTEIEFMFKMYPSMLIEFVIGNPNLSKREIARKLKDEDYKDLLLTVQDIQIVNRQTYSLHRVLLYEKIRQDFMHFTNIMFPEFHYVSTIDLFHKTVKKIFKSYNTIYFRNNNHKQILEYNKSRFRLIRIKKESYE